MSTVLTSFLDDLAQPCTMSPPASIPESTRSPSPVCSRRLKRKRKRQDPADTVISKKAKRQNSVWVGNLSFKTTTDALRGFFDGVGEITRIHMPMRAGAKGENTGSILSVS